MLAANRRFDGCQNRIEPIVRRNARTQIQKSGQPLSPLPAKLGDGHEIIRTADDRADGDDDDIDQRVGNLTFTRVGEVGNMVVQPGPKGSLDNENLNNFWRTVSHVLCG